MKAKATQLTQSFKPIELTITIENENDLRWFQELFNIPKPCLIEVNGVFRSLKDPDPEGNLMDLLEKIK